jgi:hypothetical protein
VSNTSSDLVAHTANLERRCGELEETAKELAEALLDIIKNYGAVLDENATDDVVDRARAALEKAGAKL